MVLDQSFVRDLRDELERHTCTGDCTKSNFDLKDVMVYLFGVSRRTVNKIEQSDLANVSCFAPDVVILEIATAECIIILNSKLLHHYIGVCYICADIFIVLLVNINATKWAGVVPLVGDICIYSRREDENPPLTMCCHRTLYHNMRISFLMRLFFHYRY